jgi:hypothetical protein
MSTIIVQRNRILHDVSNERDYQDRMFPPMTTRYALPDPNTPDGWKSAVLMEEVGEAAHEVNEMHLHRDSMARQATRLRLRDELIQVAAVAVAWIEALDKRETPA